MFIELIVKQYVNDEELSELNVESCDIKQVKCCINKQHISSFEESSYDPNETIIMMSSGEQITAMVNYKIFKALFFKLN